MDQGVVRIRLACIFTWILLICPGLARGQDVREILDTGGHTGIIWDLDVSADGRYLVSGSGDKSVRIWDLVEGRCVRVFSMPGGPGQQGKVFAVALSPDGRTLAMAGWMGRADPGRIVLRSVPDGRVMGTLQGLPGPIYTLAFAPGGRFLAAGSSDGVVGIWDTLTRLQVHALHGHSLRVRCLAWLGNEKLVSGSDDGNLVIWSVDTGIPLGVLSGHVGAVQCVAISPDKKIIASGGYDRTVRLWDASTMRFLRNLTTQGRPVFSVSFSADGRQVLTSIGDKGLGDNACRIFYTDSGREKIAYTAHKNTVLDSLFIPGTHLAASAGGEQLEICVWDTRDARTVQRFTSAGRRISTVGWNAAGNAIFWSYMGDDAQGSTGKKNQGIDEHFSMRLGKDGFVLLSPEMPPFDPVQSLEQVGTYRLQRVVGPAGRCEVLRITNKGQPLTTICRTPEDGLEHTVASFTPDGKYILSGGAFGVLTMYRTSDGAWVRNFVGHTSTVSCLAISPDGTRLVSGSVDQTVRIWNLETGELLLTVFCARNGEWVAWTPEGYYISSPSGENYLEFQVTDNKDLLPRQYSAQGYWTYLYRPDVVAETLKQGTSAHVLKSGRALRITPAFFADAAPPSLRIIRPLYGAVISSDRLPLVFSLGGSGCKECTIRVNGHVLFDPLDAKPLRPGRHMRIISLEPGLNTIGVACVSDRGIRSESEIRVRRVCEPWEKAVRFGQGDLYVLGVGVDALKMFGRISLSGSSRDARMVTRTLGARIEKGYATAHVRMVSDAYGQPPLIGNIRDGIAWLGQARQHDTVVLFLAGQAVTTDTRTVFLPRDAAPDGQGGFVPHTVFDLASLFRYLGRLPARAIVLLDVDHAGPLDMTRVFRQGRDRGVAILGTIQGGGKQVGIGSELPCGPFAYAVSRGLGPGFFADSSGDGEVSITELALYVHNLLHGIDPGLTSALVLPPGFGDIPIARK